VFVSHDVIFEEGEPNCTLPIMEEKIPLFDTLSEVETINEGIQKSTTNGDPNTQDDDHNRFASTRKTSLTRTGDP